jgi:hypothetical protein
MRQRPLPQTSGLNDSNDQGTWDSCWHLQYQVPGIVLLVLAALALVQVPDTGM